jgi:hypothetical protein
VKPYSSHPFLPPSFSLTSPFNSVHSLHLLRRCVRISRLYSSTALPVSFATLPSGPLISGGHSLRLVSFGLRRCILISPLDLSSTLLVSSVVRSPQPSPSHGRLLICDTYSLLPYSFGLLRCVLISSLFLYVFLLFYEILCRRRLPL